MKKILDKIILSCLLYISIISLGYSLELNSKQAILIDYETGEILYKLNEKEKVYPSSLTKIMTAYLIFEDLENGNLQLPYKFQVSKEAWQQEGSRMFLNIGSRVSIDDMLKGLIVQSGNDAAYALAEASAPNVNRFVERMNKKAKELKLENTNYTNPIGFSEEGHYMSVEDTALLARKLIEKYPQYYHKYFPMREYKYNNILQPNRNTLLKTYNGVDGIKTGHTEAGGYALATSAVRNNKRLIAVVNGASSEKDREEDSKKLLNYGFFTLKKYKVFYKGEIVDSIPVIYGKDISVKAKVGQAIYATAENLKQIRYEIKSEKELQAPIYKNEKIGTITVKTPYDEATYNIYANEDVKAVNIFEKMILKIYEKFKKY